MLQMLAAYIQYSIFNIWVLYIINYATLRNEYLWRCSHFLPRGNFCKSNTFKSAAPLPILYIGLTEITGLCSMLRAMCDQTIFKAGRPGFWNRLAQFKMGWQSVSKWVSSWESGLSIYNITVLLLSDICIGYCLWSVWYVCSKTWCCCCMQVFCAGPVQLGLLWALICSPAQTNVQWASLSSLSCVSGSENEFMQGAEMLYMFVHSLPPLLSPSICKVLGLCSYPC